MKDDIDYIGQILADVGALSILESIVIEKSAPKTFYNIKDAKEKEIVDFIEKNGREPSLDAKDIFERQLAMRAKAIKDRKAKEEGIKEEPVNPWDDEEGLAILGDVDLGNTSINDFSGAGSEIDRRRPSEDRKEAEEVSHAKPCPNFADYKPLFDNVTKAIQSGHRKLIKFEGTEFRQGVFYSRGGMLFYIAEMFEQKRKGRWGMDGRTHCIFANGTESNILASSIRRSMFENAYVVTEDDREGTEGFSLVSDKNAPKYNTGYIYVLKSLSTEPALKQFKDLYKIGVTRGEVENRIKGANKSSTYLFADVQIVEKWQCIDLNPQKLETLVHTFFSTGKVNIRVRDEKGNPYLATEWFDVPLPEIEKFVPMFLDRSFLNYRYDKSSRRIVLK